MASNNSSNSSNPPPKKNPNDDGSFNNNNNNNHNQNPNLNPRNRQVELFATTQQVAELIINSVVLPNSQCIKNRVYYSPMPDHPDVSEVTVFQVMKHNLLVHTYATNRILGRSNNPYAPAVTTVVGSNNQPPFNTYQIQHLPPMYRNPSSHVPPAPRFNNGFPSTIPIYPFIPSNINGPTIQPQMYNDIHTAKDDRTILNPKPLNIFMPPSATNNGGPLQNSKDDHCDHHNRSLDQNQHLSTDENLGGNNNTDENASYLLTYETIDEASKEVGIPKSNEDDMSDDDDDGIKKEVNKRRQVEKGKKKITSNK